MNIVLLIFDQEGVSAKCFLNVTDGKEAEKKILDRAYTTTWEDQDMTREEFDEEIASQWGFQHYAFEETFEFNGYELWLDNNENSVYSRD